MIKNRLFEEARCSLENKFLHLKFAHYLDRFTCEYFPEYSLFVNNKLTNLKPMLFSIFPDNAHCDTGAQLEILPIQSIQRKPVGKPLMLTCQANVPDPNRNTLTDLQWRDSNGLPIPPKP